MADLSDTSSSAASRRPSPPGLGRTRDLLIARPELIRGDEVLMQALGVRPIAANVVDFGPAALARLESARTAESVARQEMEELARANYEAQTQIQEAVLDLLHARNNSDLAARLDRAARERFGLRASALVVEGSEPRISGWRNLERLTVDDLLGAGGERRLGAPVAGLDLLGLEDAEIGSMALIRLDLWRTGHPGLLALASDEREAFQPEMGAELVIFLARVAERMADRWPPLL